MMVSESKSHDSATDWVLPDTPDASDDRHGGTILIVNENTNEHHRNDMYYGCTAAPLDDDDDDADDDDECYYESFPFSTKDGGGGGGIDHEADFLLQDGYSAVTSVLSSAASVASDYTTKNPISRGMSTLHTCVVSKLQEMQDSWTSHVGIRSSQTPRPRPTGATAAISQSRSWAQGDSGTTTRPKTMAFTSRGMAPSQQRSTRGCFRGRFLNDNRTNGDRANHLLACKSMEDDWEGSILVELVPLPLSSSASTESHSPRTTNDDPNEYSPLCTTDSEESCVSRMDYLACAEMKQGARAATATERKQPKDDFEIAPPPLLLQRV